MSDPQSGILNEDSIFHYHLEYRFLDNADIANALIRVRRAAKDSLQFTGEVVVGLRPLLWSSLAPQQTPDHCNDFLSIQGVGGFTAPSTQNDLWLWIHSGSHDANFDAAMRVNKVLHGTASLQLEVPGFVRYEKRDLTGFIDGSANPKGDDITAAAFVAAGSAGAGGSFALTQRWIHDLESFNVMSVAEQEAVIGRTKPDSIELEGDAMPDDSHVSRTDVKLDDVALKIYRRSVPYGLVGEYGLFFVAFACEQRRLQIQLERMFGVWRDGLHDRLIHFSRAATGSYWFVPSEKDLTLSTDGS